MSIDITEHMGLVYWIANRCKLAKAAQKGVSTTTEDLIQQGTIGLLKAAAKFDPERGVKFATYAKYWVEAYIKDYCLDQMRTVRVPARAQADAWHAGTSYKQATSIDSAFAATENSENFLDAIGMYHAAEDETPDLKEQIEVLRSALLFLKPKERTVIEGRFFRSRTLEDIGIDLGVTRERVRQIEVIAIRKLKVHLLNEAKELYS